MLDLTNRDAKSAVTCPHILDSTNTILCSSKNNLNKRSTVIIISGIAAAVIISLAITIHLRLSALEPVGHKEGETTEEVMNEILTGQPAHLEESEETEEGQTEESEESVHSENETSEVIGHEENR